MLVRVAGLTKDTITRSRPVRTSVPPYNRQTAAYSFRSRRFTHAEVSIFTRVAVRRIARFAFQLAQSRPRKMLTYVTKSVSTS